MITGGWTKDEAGHYLEYHPVKEVSFACNKGELKSLIDFLTYVYNCVGDKDQTIKHYRDWAEAWCMDDPDVVVAVQPKDI